MDVEDGPSYGTVPKKLADHNKPPLDDSIITENEIQRFKSRKSCGGGRKKLKVSTGINYSYYPSLQLFSSFFLVLTY